VKEEKILKELHRIRERMYKEERKRIAHLESTALELPLIMLSRLLPGISFNFRIRI
jgi:hypothetical protein